MRRRARSGAEPSAVRSGNSLAATFFLRGFVATGLLAALHEQQHCADGAVALSGRRILRQAVQGGMALAAGAVTTDAVQRREYRLAITAVAAGAVGLLVAEHLLATPQPGTPSLSASPQPVAPHILSPQSENSL